jgi:hypothetical protein
VLVTHDMNAVQRFCHRAMLLERGRLIALGDPRTVARRYEEVNLNRGRAGEPATGPHLGDGSAAIVDAWFEDADGRRADFLQHATPCAVGMRVRFRADVEDPVFGVVLSDQEHRMVFAATSEWGRQRTGSFASGDRVDAVVRFDNLLASGRYFASPQVGYSGAPQRLMDHRLDAASVTVEGSRENAGVVDLPHEVVIARVDSPVETA